MKFANIILMSFSNYSQYPVVSRNYANDIKIIYHKVISYYFKHPMVSRNSANGIKNVLH